MLVIRVLAVCAVSLPAILTAGYPVTDADGLGPRFDGVGALSGGGGTSVYLRDYPEAQQTLLLDLLFKPGYGAALQILKVEIGGDSQSTEAVEHSHMHFENDLNMQRGYEGWLLAQAKARNPAIKTCGLNAEYVRSQLYQPGHILFSLPCEQMALHGRIRAGSAMELARPTVPPNFRPSIS
jgi:hypothetical protein